MRLAVRLCVLFVFEWWSLPKCVWCVLKQPSLIFVFLTTLSIHLYYYSGSAQTRCSRITLGGIAKEQSDDKDAGILANAPPDHWFVDLI